MSPRAAFTACWSAEAGRVQAYARRHVGADAAADVVAETFLVAWRRWKDVPEPAQPWLIATARHIIQRHQRSLRRRLALDDRLRLLNGAARARMTRLSWLLPVRMLCGIWRVSERTTVRPSCSPPGMDCPPRKQPLCSAYGQGRYGPAFDAPE